MRYSILFLTLLLVNFSHSQNKLDLKEIMKGQDFIGYWPENPQWNIEGTAFYFMWNKDKEKKAMPYEYNIESKELKKITLKEYQEVFWFDNTQVNYSDKYQIIGSSLVRFDSKTKIYETIYQSTGYMSQLQRINSQEVTFSQDKDFFHFVRNKNGSFQIKAITNYQEPKKNNKIDSSFLTNQQKELFKYIQDHPVKKEENVPTKYDFPKKISLPCSLNENPFLSCDFSHQVVLIRKDENIISIPTQVPQYISNDGYTHNLEAREKVSKQEPNQKMYIHFLQRDTIIPLNFSGLSDIRKKPLYLDSSGKGEYEKDRDLFIHEPIFSTQKPIALLDIRASDNKDRWIVQMNLETGDIKEICKQHDDAWIGGPGISSWNMESGTLGFADNDNVVFYQSEENGFSQLYEYDLRTSKQKIIFPGNTEFEIYNVALSQDGMRYFITHNQGNTGNRSFSFLHRIHQKMVPILSRPEGAFQVSIAPNEQSYAYLFSTANHPWEIYYMNSKDKIQTQITHSTTKEFDAYSWKIPSYVMFKASDGITVHSRLYEPDPKLKNGAAVLFVHGAGYLQNAHCYWSNYYREYMFHNLLVDQGYTVLDVDYRASEGYGRDYRTAIYRFMGGRDLEDFIDAKSFLVQKFGIDSNRVGIYGGSYGGFITLMGLFTKPKSFACGAALRSVTDWAHYNHEYTSNILNYPETDELAYRKSSPIYHVGGLQKPLLILHGMVDDNVQFQDVVRLQQRLIEEGKTTWELAAYPVESHGFKEAYSWHDEYRRIYELFDKHLMQKP